MYALPWPESDGQPVHCCPVHVVRYQVEYPARYKRCVEHEKLDNPRDYHAENRFVTLKAAPPKIRAGDFKRIGVDHEGYAHYFRLVDEGDWVTILVVDLLLDAADVFSYAVDDDLLDAGDPAGGDHR